MRNPAPHRPPSWELETVRQARGCQGAHGCWKHEGSEAPAELGTLFSGSILAPVSGKLPSGRAGAVSGEDGLGQEECSWQEEQHVLKPQGEMDLGCWGMGTSL